jgi:hypothetical protein
MIARNRIWIVLLLAGLILSFVHADAQQEPQQESQMGAPNPYLKGTEGYYKGPRGLTSYMPVAIDQPGHTNVIIGSHYRARRIRFRT